MALLDTITGLVPAGLPVPPVGGAGRPPKKDDCSKSKSWSKSRGHKKSCKKH